ncbi:MAG: hypothetical protein AAFV86_14435 [Pseudomonadota bacterium]
MTRRRPSTLVVALLGLGLAGAGALDHRALAQEGQAPSAAPEAPAGAAAPMTLARAVEVFSRLDPGAEVQGGGRYVSLTIRETELLFVSDPNHNRMRLMSRIGPAAALDEAALMRIAQANFDSALDARYAVAQGQLWAVYIHPLAEHTEAQLIAAVGQVVNAVTSYGTTYSSGLITFGGGDGAAERQRELIDELLRQGDPI